MAVSSEQDYGEQFLKKFPSYNIYEKLNNKDDLNEYDKYCTIVQGSFPRNQEIYQFCRIFARNLIEISTILNDINNNIELCRYFHFWKNDQIYKIHNTSNKINNVKRIRTRFFSVASMIEAESPNEDCFYTFRNDISLELWKNWKDLYDYIRNKDKIQEIINYDTHLCKLYTHYIDYIKEVYRKYDAECCKKNNGFCPHDLNFKEWCNRDDIFYELKCTVPMNALEASSEPSQEDVERPGVTEGEAPGHRPKEERSPGQEAEQRGGALRGLEGDVRAGQVAGLHVNGLVHTTDTGHSSLEANEETTKGNETNPVGTIVGTSLGFVLPLITIYRFTPLGSWINTKIFRKDRLMENMKRNERELLLNSSGIGETNFDNTRYQIMYNSAHNE